MIPAHPVPLTTGAAERTLVLNGTRRAVRSVNRAQGEDHTAMTTDTTPRHQSGATGESTNFTAEERAAMKERAKETRVARKRQSAAQKAAEAERAVMSAIEMMADDDRAIAQKFHALVTQSAPQLAPKLWYGMPAYAHADSVVCFFQPAAKFKARYATIGFSDQARLDDGAMWPASFAVTEITSDVERQIEALLRRAIG